MRNLHRRRGAVEAVVPGSTTPAKRLGNPANIVSVETTIGTVAKRAL